MRLSVIIPAYNEEKNLKKNILLYDRYLAGRGFSYEIIAVDDGSTDRTREVAAALGSEMKNLRVIANDANRGKGAAVRSGMLAAAGDFRLFLDADNATSIDHLGLVWPLFEGGCGVVIGSRNPRDADGAAQVSPQPRWKRNLGACGNALIRALAVPGIRDTQCGFKIFTRRAAEDIFPRARIDRWGFDVEILSLARTLGYKIGMIPARWINCPRSRVGISGYFSALGDLARIKWNFLKNVYKL